MRHSPSINYYYYMTEQGEHANSGTNVMWANNEPWPTTTNLPISLTINMLGQWRLSVISKHEYALTCVWISIIKSCKNYGISKRSYWFPPQSHLSLFGQTDSLPMLLVKPETDMFGCSKSRVMYGQGHRVAYLLSLQIKLI